MAETFQLSEGRGLVDIQKHPDECPICHNKIVPVLKFSRLGGRKYRGDVEILYLCPNNACDELFIGYFERSQGGNKLVGARPVEPAAGTFSNSISEISQSFCTIYGEAHKAEQFGLTQICGVGYRKSLEFLIKDYLIKTRPNDKAGIESTMLGPCIESYVIDPRIKGVAKRATWLGNDETHYQRRWVDKDLSDLKNLINLVIHWVEAEHLTEQALKSMQPTGKP